MSNDHLPEIQAPLRVIARQEYQDAIAFQSRYSYDPYDNALLPSASMDYEPLSLDNMATFAEHHAIFDNPVFYGSNPSPHPISAGSLYPLAAYIRWQPISAGSSSKAGSEDVLSKPGSSSTLRRKPTPLLPADIGKIASIRLLNSSQR